MFSNFSTMLAVLHLSMFVVLAAATGPPVPDARPALRRKLTSKVFPTAYELTFRFENDFAETNKFDGDVTIAITIGSLSESDYRFQVHGEDINIDSTVLKNSEKTFIVSFSNPNETTQLVEIEIQDKSIQPGDYLLLFHYTGRLNEKETVGLYKTSYRDQSRGRQFLVGSRFLDNYARRAFPCFDEPAMKATFQVTIIYPKDYNVKSNTEGSDPELVENTNLEKVIFLKTPVMSTYLVAVLVSRFSCKQGETLKSSPAIEICSQLDTKDPAMEITLDASRKILHKMSSFTGYTYGDINKVTLTAIPDFQPSAMENWGLISFREPFLLWNKYESSTKNKQQSLTILAQELSHQWFGNLVTLKWWDDFFINEGLARFFAYYVADKVEPTWELQKQFAVEEVQRALFEDSWGNSVPLSSFDANPLRKRRTDLSYMKGASVIRMFQHFLGMDNFQKGIRRYIDQYKKGNATSAQFWDLFDFQNVKHPALSLHEIVDSWVNKPGYPLIFAEAQGDNIILKQEEFHPTEGNATKTEWYVPITYSYSTASAMHTSTEDFVSPVLQGSLPDALKGREWVVLNNQRIGYYRVHYSQNLLEKISDALQKDINSIDEMSRAILIDDYFNIARTQYQSYRDVLNFISFLKNDDSYYSWSAAFSGFSFLLKHTANDGVKRRISTIMESQMKTLSESTNSLVLPVDHVSTLKQIMLSKWRCRLNETRCISDAIKRFTNYKGCPEIKPPPDLKPIVYCYGLRNSSNTCIDYLHFWELYLNATIPTEKVMILEALGCTSDDYLIKHLLMNAFTGETIPIHDLQNVLEVMCYHSPHAVTTILLFLMENHKSIIKKTTLSQFDALISKIAENINMQSQFDMLIDFNNKKLLPEVSEIMIDAIKIGNYSLSLAKKIEDDLFMFITR